MPSPIETLFLIQLSPEPAQTILGFVGSIATAPIDWTFCWSNTGLNVVPPSTDFHTPPLADPMMTVSRPLSSEAVTAATRPLIMAEPMFRAGRPEIVPASNRASVDDGWLGVCAPVATDSIAANAAAARDNRSRLCSRVMTSS
jgi:hypothetical protein